MAGRPPGRGARAAARRRPRVRRPRDPQRPRGGDGRGRRTPTTARGVLRDRARDRPRARRGARQPRRAGAAATTRRRTTFGIQALAAGSLGRGLSAQVLGRILSTPQPGQEALHARLTELPSATTVGERWFFHNYAAHLWSGDARHLRERPAARRHDARDRHRHARQPAPRPRGACCTRTTGSTAKIALDVDDPSFDRLIAAGLLRPRDARRAARAPATSAASSRSCTRGHDYSPLLRVHTSALPGSVAESHTMADLYVQDAEARFDLVFVDGCKSWYGTRWFLERIAPTIRPGAHVVMQDFGWYTCFWLSALVGVLPEPLPPGRARRPHVRVRAAAADHAGRRRALPRAAGRARRVGLRAHLRRAAAWTRGTTTTAGAWSR